MKAEIAKNTSTNYASSWRNFESWCAGESLTTLPAAEETVSKYALWSLNEGAKITTVRARLHGIAYHHRHAGMPSPVTPEIRSMVACARRDRKESPRGRVPLDPANLRRILSLHSEADPIDVRNRSVLLSCFAAGWRRSEITGLDLSDVSFVPEGMTLWQAWSKTDQVGEGRLVGINHGNRRKGTCPVNAMREWLKVRGDWPGPLFVRFVGGGGSVRISDQRLGGDYVRRLVKRGITKLGLDSSRYGAHSLRAGFVTSSAQNGADIAAIIQRTGHKDLEMVMRYIRPTQVFQRNPLAGVL